MHSEINFFFLTLANVIDPFSLNEMDNSRLGILGLTPAMLRHHLDPDNMIDHHQHHRTNVNRSADCKNGTRFPVHQTR